MTAHDPDATVGPVAVGVVALLAVPPLLLSTASVSVAWDALGAPHGLPSPGAWAVLGILLLRNGLARAATPAAQPTAQRLVEAVVLAYMRAAGCAVGAALVSGGAA